MIMRWSGTAILGTVALGSGFLGLITLVLLIGQLFSGRRSRGGSRGEEAGYRAIVEAQTDLIRRFGTDRRLTYVNDIYCEYWRKSREELLGRDFSAPLADEERQRAIENVAGLNRECPTSSYEQRVERDGGETRWLSWCDRALFDERGEVIGYQAVGRDITPWKIAPRAGERWDEGLQERVRRGAGGGEGASSAREAVLRLILDEIPILLAFYDERANPIPLNREWERVLGWTEEDLRGRDLLAELYPDPEIRTAFIEHGKETDGRRKAFPVRARDGQTFAIGWTNVRLSNGWVLGIGQDLSERERVSVSLQESEERSRRHALHDCLTGLPNRALLMERIGEALSRARERVDYLFAVLFIDLDRFKVVNDGLGHLMGDRLLVEIARKLQGLAGVNDTVARLGGDEFIWLADNLSGPDEASRLARTICGELGAPCLVEGRKLSIGASIGIAFGDDPGQSGTDLLRNADLAMYEAKVRGKGRHAIFDPAMHRRASRLWELETDLRLALERTDALAPGEELPPAVPGEFVVYYQPIVRLEGGEIVGFEALARWFHPVQGAISPAEFIPIAEEAGLIVSLGRWILWEACHQLKRWQERSGLALGWQMSVNLSGSQLQRGDLLEQIARVLDLTGLDARCLKLEITESVLMENTDIAIEILSRLREKRIGISIDDFGTGYSSLSYLHRLPVDRLKIDRSFVGRMDEDRENRAIVEAVIGLAHHLEVEVVAEGIETEEQLARLQSLGCEFGQGYLFSRPLDRDGIENYLSSTLSILNGRKGSKIEKVLFDLSE